MTPKPCTVALACAITGAACGPAAGDPMRPWTAPSSASVAATAAPRAAQSAGTAVSPATGGGVPAAATGAARSAPWNAQAPLDLVAIREGAEGQRLALVGKNWLKPGDRFTDAHGAGVVVHIGAEHVETQRGQGHYKSYLLPPLLPAGDAVQPAPPAQARPRRPAPDGRPLPPTHAPSTKTAPNATIVRPGAPALSPSYPGSTSP